MPISLVRPVARTLTTALSLLASGAALIAVLAFSTEARADGPKQGASTAQVLAQESKPMPKASPQAGPKTHAHANANANAKAKAQPHPKATKPHAKAAKAKAHAKPAKAKAPAKPAKPGATARV